LPLTEETFKIQFTASRAFRDKLREAQDLLRHRVPDGDLASILDVDRIRLLCRAHNQYAAEQTYGRAFMEQARGPPH
jgi:hypothetical protein